VFSTGQTSRTLSPLGSIWTPPARTTVTGAQLKIVREPLARTCCDARTSRNAGRDTAGEKVVDNAQGTNRDIRPVFGFEAE